MKKIILLSLLIYTGSIFAIDITPSESVMDVPWNSTEKETVKKLGEPNGYFNITKFKKIVFYGKSIGLVFNRGKLKGFRYYDTCCMSLYDMPVSINSKYQTDPLLLNGIELTNKSFSELNDSLTYELGKPNYNVEIATDEATIKFSFTGRGYPGSGTQDFTFSSIEIDFEL